MKKTVGTFMVLLALTACTTKRGYVEKGNAFFQHGKYQDAEISYQKAIQKDRNYGEAYYRLGLVALQQNNAVEAYNALFRASQLLPTNMDVQEKFGGLCLDEYLKDPKRPQKLYQQVQQSASELLSQNPNSFEGLRLKGFLAHEDRKSEDAISYFQKALQVQPGNAPRDDLGKQAGISAAQSGLEQVRQTLDDDAEQRPVAVSRNQIVQQMLRPGARLHAMRQQLLG